MREFQRDTCLVFIPYIDLIIPAISLIDSTLSAHVSSSIVYSSFAQVGDMAGWFNVETGHSDLYTSSRIPIAHHPEHSAGPRRASFCAIHQCHGRHLHKGWKECPGIAERAAWQFGLLYELNAPYKTTSFPRYELQRPMWRACFQTGGLFFRDLQDPAWQTQEEGKF